MNTLDPSKCYRVMPESIDNKTKYLSYLRHLYAYEVARDYLNKGSKVLEVGFGEGYGTAYLAEYVAEITALDITAELVQHASSKYRASNVSFKQFDGNVIPAADETYDVIISYQVIEHVPDVQKYLQEISRVLKKGGYFLATTPNRAYRLYKGQRPWNEHHLREYYSGELLFDAKKVFANSEIKGIQGKGEAQRLEILRGDRLRKMHRFDPLNLRKLLPGNIRSILFKKAVQPNDGLKPEDKEKYSLNDFQVIKNDLDQSLDLLLIARK